jgi:nucleoside-diphosphate-sugar epimerase
MRIIVTGGAGYLGSVLVPWLRGLGHEVLVIDSLRYGQPDEGSIVSWDTADLDTWNDVDFANTEAVINLAALVGEDLCKKYPEEAKRTNVEGTRLAARYCRENYAKLIQASTCSNYGISEGIADEESPLKPLGIYAETKVESEKEASHANEYTILRFGTLYGISPRMRWDIMINDWVYECLMNGKIEVYSMNAYRPFLHIYDACKAIQTVLDTPSLTRNQIYNVASINIMKEHLAETIAKATNATWVVGGGNDKRDYKVNCRKFTRDTHFIPSHTNVTLPFDLREIRVNALVQKTSNAGDYRWQP